MGEVSICFGQLVVDVLDFEMNLTLLNSLYILSINEHELEYIEKMKNKDSCKPFELCQLPYEFSKLFESSVKATCHKNQVPQDSAICLQ